MGLSFLFNIAAMCFAIEVLRICDGICATRVCPLLAVWPCRKRRLDKEADRNAWTIKA